MAEKITINASNRNDNKQNPLSTITGDITQLSQEVGNLSGDLLAQIAHLDKRYLRKDIPDISYVPTSFDDHLAIKTFATKNSVQGKVIGKGAILNQNSDGTYELEIDYISVRKKMFVNEVIIQQIKHTGGVNVTSAGNLIASKVEIIPSNGADFPTEIASFIGANNVIRCYFDNADGDIQNTLGIGDICLCQRINFNGSNMYVKYYKRRVVNTSSDYIDLEPIGITMEGVVSDSVQVGDNLIQWGHLWDKQRQSIVEINTLDGGKQSFLQDMGDCRDVLPEDVRNFTDYDSLSLDQKRDLWQSNKWYDETDKITVEIGRIKRPDGTYYNAINILGNFSATIKSIDSEGKESTFGLVIDNETGKVLIACHKLAIGADLKDLEETLDKLENIQIGGVNLLNKSGNFSEYGISGSWVIYLGIESLEVVGNNLRLISESSGIPRARNNTLIPLYEEPRKLLVTIRYIGDDVTPSAKSSTSLTTLNESGSQNGGTFIDKGIVVNGEIKTRTFEWTTLPKGYGNNSLASFLLFGIPVNSQTDIINIMVEEGNTPTSWSPSLNDQKASSSGKGIDTIQNFYLISANNTGVTTSTSGWQEDVINPTASKKYLWNYEKITYTDSSFTDTTPAVISTYVTDGTDGTNGSDGADGIGISDITEYYAVNNSTTPPADSSFSTTVKNPTTTNRYLWAYEKITYTNNTTQNTSKRIMAVYGEKGDNGEPSLPTIYRTSAAQPDTPTDSSVPPANWRLTPDGDGTPVMITPDDGDGNMVRSAADITVTPSTIYKQSGEAFTGDEVVVMDGSEVLPYVAPDNWNGRDAAWTFYSPSDYIPNQSRVYTLLTRNSVGEQYFRGELTIIMTDVEKVLSYISVISPPTKDTYNVGEVLDTNGMIVRAYYTDGTNANLTDAQVSESYNFSTAGEKTVTVSFGGKTDTFTVTVVEAEVTLASIDVVNPPTKTIYYVGESLNTSGMIVNATYSNGSSSTIPNNQVQTSYNFDSVGSKTVTVTYQDKSDTFSVSVQEQPVATLTRIDIMSTPQKTDYKVGESLNTNGISVLGTYSDGNTIDVTSQCTYNPTFFGSVGIKTITVSFGGKTDTFTVDVYEPESSTGSQIWACTALGWNATGGVTGWSTPTRWNGEDGARNSYTLFSFAYGASLTLPPSNWSYEVPEYVEGQNLWQRVQQYEPNATNTGWNLISTSYSVLREYVDGKIEDAKNEAISTFFEGAISAAEIAKLKDGSAPFVFDTDKELAYLRKAIIEYLATDKILTDLIIAKNIKTALSGERVEITQSSRGLTAFDEDGNIAMKVHGKEFSTFSSAPTTVSVAQKSITKTADSTSQKENIGETDVAIATITIAAGKDVNEVTLPAATIDLQALVELGSIIEGLGYANISVRLMLNNIELGALTLLSENGTRTNSVTIPSQKLSLASGSHSLYFRASWDCSASEGAEVAQVTGSVRWASSTIHIDYKDDVAEFSKEGLRLASNSSHYIEWKRLADGTIQETRVGVKTNATYGVLAAGMISTSGSLSKSYGKVTSSSRSSTGMYRINHSIGHTNYTPQISLYGEAGFADIQGIYSTYFTIRTRTTALDLGDKSFTFACIGD